jgi:ligand-binding sensor protein/AraC-like DNA-binding protein
VSLDKVLNLEKWQSLQDSLSTVTKLAIITVDYKGVPISPHSNIRPFCKYVRSHPELSNLCQKCDSRGGLEAVRVNSPYIYLCHCNIIDIAIPIIINDTYVGAIMAGQVKLTDEKPNDFLEQILISPKKEHFNFQEKGDLQHMYDSIPSLSYSEIENIAKMLSNLCHYILEEAMSKNLLLDMCGNMESSKETSSTNLLNNYSLDNIQHIKKELESTIANSYIKTSFDDNFLCKNPTLKPAFNYIFNNKGENIYQKKMADLCHISTGYFSRLFLKETGKNFSTFISLQKIEWSKQLLEKTDFTIGQISDELGFNDPGYYIRTFKKCENLTPYLYRKYYKENS